MNCWEIRGCDGDQENFGHCPHTMLGGRCPVDCAYTVCERPQHKQADVLDLLDPDVDRMAAVKEYCNTCAFFIKNGPRLADRAEGEEPAWKVYYAKYEQDPSLPGFPNIPIA